MTISKLRTPYLAAHSWKINAQWDSIREYLKRKFMAPKHELWSLHGDNFCIGEINMMEGPKADAGQWFKSAAAIMFREEICCKSISSIVPQPGREFESRGDN